jgi:hypothetical protein
MTPFTTINETLRFAPSRDMSRLRSIWPRAVDLFAVSPELRLAFEAFELGRYVPNALALIAVWGALESIFAAGAQNEITFRLSSYIAAYLRPAGAERRALQTRVKKLYGKRSAAAHGKPKDATNDLCETCEITKDCLVQMIENGHAPNAKELDELLYG